MFEAKADVEKGGREETPLQLAASHGGPGGGIAIAKLLCKSTARNPREDSALEGGRKYFLPKSNKGRIFHAPFVGRECRKSGYSVWSARHSLTELNCSRHEPAKSLRALALR